MSTGTAQNAQVPVISATPVTASSPTTTCSPVPPVRNRSIRGQRIPTNGQNANRFPFEVSSSPIAPI